MRKRVTALVLVLMLIVSLCACDRVEDKVGLCLQQTESTMAQQTARMLTDILERSGTYGCSVTVWDAGMDQSKQLQQIRGLLEQECNLLVVEPVMVSAAGDIVAMARKSHVPLIFIGQKPDDTVLESWDQVCYVGFDPAAPGALQSGLLQQLPDRGDLNGDGAVSYYVIGGPEDDLDTRLRTTGFVEGLTQAELQAQCMGSAWGDWTRQSGQQLTAKALAHWGKDLEVLVCSSDELAIGALEAIRDGGRTVGKDVYLLGIDGDQHALALIRSGELTGTVARDLHAQAQQVSQLARTLPDGEEAEKAYYVDYVPVTGENIEEYVDE